MKNIIYFISGLGADARVIKKLQLKDVLITQVNWITPDSNDTLATYAEKLIPQIQTEEPILMGISFGGMLAVEIAKHKKVSKLILLNTAKTKYELPFYFRWFAALHLQKIIPYSWLVKQTKLSAWFFGVTSRDDKELLSTIIMETDLYFLKWAIQAILNWENKEMPKAYFHLHGAKDKILPARFVSFTDVVQGAGHLMPMTHPAEISKILNQLL